jgi:hypothetical protein
MIDRLAPNFRRRLSKSPSSRLMRLGPMLKDCTIRTEDKICSTSVDGLPSRSFAGPPTTLFAHPRKVKMPTTKGITENKTPPSFGEFAKLEEIACNRLSFFLGSGSQRTYSNNSRDRPDQIPKFLPKRSPDRRDILARTSRNLPRSDFLVECGILHQHSANVCKS